MGRVEMAWIEVENCLDESKHHDVGYPMDAGQISLWGQGPGDPPTARASPSVWVTWRLAERKGNRSRSIDE
jgi:hypothetical protein